MSTWESRSKVWIIRWACLKIHCHAYLIHNLNSTVQPLSAFWYHASSFLMTASTPSFLPSSLKTIQARGTFPLSSLDLGLGITPATTTSARSPCGSESNASSIWYGDTWRPAGVLNVSLILPTILYKKKTKKHPSQSIKWRVSNSTY